ncbi:hypothetical protein Tco_0126765, partial [Tanacetum coccineum]
MPSIRRIPILDTRYALRNVVGQVFTWTSIRRMPINGGVSPLTGYDNAFTKVLFVYQEPLNLNLIRTSESEYSVEKSQSDSHLV